MILRKPYAFLIKHFKLIHLIMFLFMSFLVYQTNTLLEFFNDFILSSQIILGTDISNIVINSYVYLLIIGIILVSIIVFILMTFKEKPRLYYALTILGYILLIILYAYTNSVIGIMQKEIVDERIIRAIRDFLNIAFIFQLYTVFVAVIRAIGLDVKKFSFKEDIEELDLKDEDNEEFEVNIEFDSQTLKRNVKRNYRNIKYYYLENKVIILTLAAITILVTGFAVIRSLTNKSTKYGMNQEFSVQGYNIIVENGYITSKDLKANQIVDEDKTLVVVKLKLKSFISAEKFVAGKLALKVDKTKYYHNISFRNSLIDIGKIYVGQELNEEYQDFILVYEIPNNDKDKSMNLVYTKEVVNGMFNNKTDDIIVPLSAINLDEVKEDNIINLGQNYIVGEGLLSGYEIKLNSFMLDSSFKVDYMSCVKTNECYNYYELLQPSLSGISDKALLKLNMDLIVPENKNITSVEKLITTFGKLEYEINNQKYVQSIVKNIVSIHKDDNYYFEIKRDVLNAEKISLVINARNNRYVFELR